MKEKIEKLELIKIKKKKKFCSAKDIFKRIKRQATDWEKIHVKDIFDKGLLSKIYKEFLRLDKQLGNNNLILKMSQRL